MSNSIIRFGVSGDVGSFSEEAGLMYAKRLSLSPEIVFLIDMEGVLAGLVNDEIDLGIFPVVNLHGGLVKMAFEAMGKYPFRMIDELWLDVQQCLLVRPGVQFDQITKIVSHPQALAQCRHYLQNQFSEIKTVSSRDTALSAKELAEKRIETTAAVLGSERVGNLYGLDVLAKNIQDQHPNLTAFIIVEKG